MYYVQPTCVLKLSKRMKNCRTILPPQVLLFLHITQLGTVWFDRKIEANRF